MYQGTATSKYISLMDKTTDTPLDIADWTFRAQLRDHPADTNSLGELTTENGGILIVEPLQGRMALVFSDELTATLPLGRIHFDVVRVNAPSGPQWLFGGSFVVKQPVTR